MTGSPCRAPAWLLWCLPVSSSAPPLWPAVSLFHLHPLHTWTQPEDTKNCRFKFNFTKDIWTEVPRKWTHSSVNNRAKWFQPNPLKDIRSFSLEIEQPRATKGALAQKRPPDSSSIASRTLLNLLLKMDTNSADNISDCVTFLEAPVFHPGCSGRWPPAQRSLPSVHLSASPAHQLSAGCPATLSSTWPRFHSGLSPARSAWLLPHCHASPAPLWLSSQPTVKGSV